MVTLISIGEFSLNPVRGNRASLYGPGPGLRPGLGVHLVVFLRLNAVDPTPFEQELDKSNKPE